MKQNLLVFISIACLFGLLSCGKDTDVPKDTDLPMDQVTDYSVAENWAMNAQGSDAKGVDLFFMLPTVWLPESNEEKWCSVDNASLRERGPMILKATATAFEQSCNLYSPFYRQLNASNVLEKSEEERLKALLKVPYVDVQDAFVYFLEHYNNGRPFIIAGHSQGSMVGITLLQKYLHDHPNVQERMVAAYLIGYGVNRQDTVTYKNMHEAKSATDLGTIISWNTETGDMVDPNPVCSPNAMCINPIHWSTEAVYGAKEESQGSFMSENGVYVRKEQFADAKINIERRSLVTTSVKATDFDKRPLFPFGCLHAIDYPLYFFDIQKNAKDRIDRWMELK